MLAPGLEHTLEVAVTEDMTASHVRVGGVGVLSTPAMMRLIELAAHACVQ
jgi:predicted thioesterase